MSNRPITSYFKPKKDAPSEPPPEPARPVQAAGTVSLQQVGTSTSTSLGASKSLGDQTQSPSDQSGPKEGGAAAPAPSTIPSDRVIAASDDEDSDSDSDFEDLAQLIRNVVPKRPAAATKPSEKNDGDAVGTAPNAQWTATIGARSATAFRPPPTTTFSRGGAAMGGRKTSARFDMRTLKRHAQQDRRTEESAKRATNVLGTAATTDSAALDESGADLGARKQGLARIVAQHSKGEDVSFEKVMRAVERVHDSMGHGPWYFFDTTRLPSTRIPSNFPSEALRKAGGPWAVLGSSCCRDARQRDWRFTSGMVRAVVRNGHRLPLPLVDWMLFEAVPTECSAALRDEYIRLLAAEPSHTGSRLTADRVFDLFVGLGMVADVQRNMDVRIRIRSRMEEGPLPPPHDYAWENLRAVLRTLTAVAPGMSVDALSMALRILLMMGVDRVIVRNSDVAVDYQDAIEALASAVPDDQWDSVCGRVCLAVFTSFNDVSLRLSSLTCLPVVTPRLHELRRRLATAFFFDKAALSESHPDRAVHFKDILLRLEDSVFRPTHDTDFHELGAYVSLLNLAVDAGYLWDADSEMERQRFDEAIDVLAAKLYLILSKITEAGGIFIARTETKTMLSLVAVRLLCSVRLKPKRKKRVYDVDYFEADDGITMQQNYMKKFLGAARSDENVRET